MSETERITVAYDEELAERACMVVDDLPGITTRKMFGGFAIMWNGNMLAGVVGDELMARVGSDQFDELLEAPGAREMDFAGRPMRGMLYIAADAVADDEGLELWIKRCRDFVSTLPPKKAKGSR